MNRATLYRNQAAILEYIRKAHVPESGDMFHSKEERFALKLTPSPEFSLNDRLWYERKATGAFMHGHPMQLVQGKYENRITHRLCDVPQLLDGPTVPVALAFMIRRMYIARGKIVILTAEDETGVAEINAFVSDCDPWWHLLRADNILAAHCIPKHSGQFSSMHFMKLHKLGELQRPQ